MVQPRRSVGLDRGAGMPRRDRRRDDRARDFRGAAPGPRLARAPPGPRRLSLRAAGRGSSLLLERRHLIEHLDLLLHCALLAPEEIRHRVAKPGMRDEMRRPGWHRPIAPRQLVFTLRTRFDPLEPACDRRLDRLIIAELEMEEGHLLCAAP